jgi:His/Glu/Gln/Arg/opine family amino acid ABC transporter permease subunit
MFKTLSENGQFLGEALGRTVLIAFSGFAIGLVLAIVIAVSQTYPKPKFWLKIINKFFDVYIWLIRCVPVVVMLLAMYFVFLPDLRLPAMTIAIIVFSMYPGAFLAVILRDAINAIDKGQLEAGRALGLGYWYTMFRVVLPQAFKNSIQSIGNILILLIKDTAVLGFITVIDITRAIQLIVGRTFDLVTPYVILLIFYVVIVSAIIVAIRLVEKLVFRQRLTESC